MSKHTTALDVLRALPEATRKKLNLSEFEAITGAVVIKDRIQDFYVRVAREEKQLRTYKEVHGYCAGLPSCMVFIGKASPVKACQTCRKYWRDMKASGPSGKKRERSEYGKIRMKERKVERESR